MMIKNSLEIKGSLDLLPPEPIAVIGMAGFFPGASNLLQYWDNLLEGRDCIVEVPPERWSLDGFFTPHQFRGATGATSYCKWGGFLDAEQTKELLAAEFNCDVKDRQSKLILRTIGAALQSLEKSSSSSSEDYRKTTGVYVGAIPFVEDANIGAFEIVGNGQLAGAISRAHGLSGPSIVLDLHSASAISALHLACAGLRAGDCETAIAAAGMMLNKDHFVFGSQAGILANDPTYRSYAQERSGIILGEGAGAVVLRPLSKAVANQDPILAVIRTTNHGFIGNHNVNSSDDLLISLDFEKVTSLVEGAIMRARVDPQSISYLDCAAPGLPIGDVLELEATLKAFSNLTSAKNFCAVGSVKPNIGHLAAASGISQLIKVILQIKNKKISPMIKALPIDREINLEDSAFYLKHELAEWKRPVRLVGGVEYEHPRRALVNSFGYGGFFACAIVEEYLEESRG
ncbi:polyketide synthase [Pseudomonas sp. MSSRFD41]|uniref:beta-ketoacyl [acyl carrier protein] synthase domain-containing protein n=1 Tax=unclassified Pseudomonas TaxID=196821 RepID=UPI00163AE6FB|nr:MULTISPECIES: polyketide synthase [unclassified Pseudomonas]MBC2660085.1 polyketide synthase [Pseudomonas sp. MSSRFD41]UMZ10716.1 polyketide synthase [Pseudomonas sp. MPFS]